MIRAIIVDDEKAAIDMLRELLQDTSVLEVVACFNSSVEASKYIEANPIDIAFIDIEMPEMNGFELANHILFGSSINSNCAVVFITAYNIYAVEAFEINALDYLTKPVCKDRINKTIEKIIKRFDIKHTPSELKIRCFGSFRILVDGVEIKFRTNKAQELLAFLIHKQGKSVNRNEIIDNLWGEFEGDRALINFNTTLSYVKKALLQYNINIPIVYERGGSYRIDLQGIDCDYTAFLDCKINEDMESNEIACDYYEKIIAYYTGNYLEAHEYLWAENRKNYLKNRYIHILLLLTKYYNIKQDYNRITKLMEEGFMITPLDANIAYCLVSQLLKAGNYSLAVSYYKMHKDALKKELNIEPDNSLKKLMGFARS